MKGKLLLVTAILLAFASLTMAQNFQCNFRSYTTTSNYANLSDQVGDACARLGNPLADGTVVTIIDNYTGLPADTAHYWPYTLYYCNSFVMNGAADLGAAGNFYTLAIFGNDNYPCVNPDDCDPVDDPLSFHLEAIGPCVGGFMVKWISTAFTPAVGPSQVSKAFTAWTCELIPCGEPCVPTTAVNFTPFPAPRDSQDVESACVTLCEGSMTVICVGPVPLPDRIPHVSILPGCNPENTPCNDPDCTPILVPPPLSPWVLSGTPPDLYYCANLMYAGEEGCVCVTLDFIEPVEGVSVDIAVVDDAVRLNWSSASESDLDKYIISRNGSEIGFVRANNAASEYSFVDEDIEFGVNYTYELAVLDLTGHRTVLATASITPSEGAMLVTEYALHQNFPNPFNPSTSIRFDLVEANFVTLKVFNATGQEVATLVNGNRPLGVNTVNFDAANLTSGLYFYTVQVGDVYSATKKMLLVK